MFIAFRLAYSLALYNAYCASLYFFIYQFALCFFAPFSLL